MNKLILTFEGMIVEDINHYPGFYFKGKKIKDMLRRLYNLPKEEYIGNTFITRGDIELLYTTYVAGTFPIADKKDYYIIYGGYLGRTLKILAKDKYYKY